MFGKLLFSGLSSLSSLFDKLLQVAIQVRCRIVCCSTNKYHISMPDTCKKRQITVETSDTFKSLD